MKSVRPMMYHGATVSGLEGRLAAHPGWPIPHPAIRQTISQPCGVHIMIKPSFPAAAFSATVLPHGAVLVKIGKPNE